MSSDNQDTWRMGDVDGKTMNRELVFDVGAHRGEDSAYYLALGYRVVSVECDPAHLRYLAARFKAEIDLGRLVIVDRAIGPSSGDMTFYRNKNVTVWGTADRRWAVRNIAEGTEIEEITVSATTPGAIFHKFGMPFYLKIDIEGMDMLVLSSLERFTARPQYVSIESDATSFDALRNEFATLRRLGYDRFKLSPQHSVRKMKLPHGSSHGQIDDYVFEEHSSGPFGEDLPGPWLTESEAIAEYKAVFVLYDLYDALQKGVLKGSVKDFRMAYGHDAGGWYDTHARHKSARDPKTN